MKKFLKGLLIVLLSIVALILSLTVYIFVRNKLADARYENLFPKGDYILVVKGFDAGSQFLATTELRFLDNGYGYFVHQVIEDDANTGDTDKKGEFTYSVKGNSIITLLGEESYDRYVFVFDCDGTNVDFNKDESDYFGFGGVECTIIDSKRFSFLVGCK